MEVDRLDGQAEALGDLLAGSAIQRRSEAISRSRVRELAVARGQPPHERRGDAVQERSSRSSTSAQVLAIGEALLQPGDHREIGEGDVGRRCRWQRAGPPGRPRRSSTSRATSCSCSVWSWNWIRRFRFSIVRSSSLRSEISRTYSIRQNSVPASSYRGKTDSSCVPRTCSGRLVRHDAGLGLPGAQAGRRGAVLAGRAAAVVDLVACAADDRRRVRVPALHGRVHARGS